MDKQSKEVFQKNAQKIHDLGWRQGSIFEPNKTKIQIPSNFYLDLEEELLMIVSQSCSVVSPNFNVLPSIEAMVIKKIKKFNPKSFEAIGKNQSRLHLKVLNSEAIECDINKRFFFERVSLLNFPPNNNFILEKNEPKRLASWLGRNYTRTALPNEFVIRMKKNLTSTIEEILKIKTTDSTSLHENIINIYLNWEPRDDDNLFPSVYKLWLFFLCKKNEVSDVLGMHLHEKLADFMQNEGKDGIKIEDIKCQTEDETFLNALNPYDRFSEWDYLTSLDEIQFTV